jgi:hypothetical protein
LIIRGHFRRKEEPLVKKLWILILTLFASLSFSMVASARTGYGYHHQPPPYYRPHSSDRFKARRVLDVTRDYVFRADRVAHRYQRDSLKRAFYLQRQARYYYSRGHYRTTIRYSLQARDVAVNIIKTAGCPAPWRGPPYRHKNDASISIRLNL